MVAVQRYNVILEIDEEELDKYMSLGYNQIDINTGEILHEAIPTDVNVLKLKYQEHKEKIAELEQQVKDLTAKLKKREKKQ
jgi:polyhydroxyalkanoate synthesis regulator phasin